jgi:uncharacterized membrane protein YfhO
MCTDPISVQFWPLHTTFYSSHYEKIEIVDPTMTSNTPQERPRTCNKVYIFFLIPYPKGWNQVLMGTDQISIQFWPLHTTFYSFDYESNEMMDPTMISNNPT